MDQINTIAYLQYINIGLTDVSTVADCYACVQQLNPNKVCRNFDNERSSYCCTTSETGRGCSDRDFCTNTVTSLSMQMFACPFNYNSCGSSSSFIKISDLTKRNYKLNNTVTKSFKNESICYWQISVDSSLYNLSSKYFYINIQINSYSGLYVHLNNGTTILNANNHIQIDGFLGGTNFTYQAFNNTIYIIVAAYEAKPILDFSYQLINLTPKNNCINIYDS